MKNFILLVLIFYTNMVFGQVPFSAIDSSYSGLGLIIPKNLKYQILFAEGDIVQNEKGQSAAAKGDHDYNCFIPQAGSSEWGQLYVSHEGNDTSNLLGDGGGATILDIHKKNNQWSVTTRSNVDFSGVGGTISNCSGALTSKNTILTSEEFPPSSNLELFRNGTGYRDTTKFGNLPRWQNMGWMVEADVAQKKSLKKLYQMGRYSHEGALVLPDNKTVFLTDDNSPSVFFKFVAYRGNEFSEGQLFAYQQGSDGLGGKWLKLPMAMDSLVDARNVALRLGATFFLRMEWITMVDGKIYISETGTDHFEYNALNCFAAKPAKHLKSLEKPTQTTRVIDYPFGAILVLDLEKNSVKPHIWGGPGIKDSKKHFSNPDGITYCKQNGKTYLVINEDIIGLDNQRVSPQAASAKRAINEIWWLDLSIKNPTTDHLQRFMIAPANAETTGGYFTPDFKNYFVNIQHPSLKNAAPWNKSCTIVVSGFTVR